MIRMNRINLENIIRDREFTEKFGPDKEEGFNLLGQGEYNINYIFKSKTYNKRLVLRIATDSQIGLKNQIKYEYEALKLLNNSNRTPRPIYYDDSKKLIPYGFLLMDYLPGRHLDYKKDLKLAAEALAHIHNQPIHHDNHLIKPHNPLGAIYEESLNMFEKYRMSDYKNKVTEDRIQDLLDKGANIKNQDIGSRTIINTELNSGNFLINGGDKNYVIDWEKPIWAYPAQDLGHFLAPTTSFWKTDTILSKDEISLFIGTYCQNSNQYKDQEELLNSVKAYLSMNCLRGITWCSMAYVEYQNPNRPILNTYTYEKIKSYLSEEFLNMIKGDYLNDY